MDIVVRGRNVEVPEHYRQHVADKLRRVERYDHKVIRIDVELYHERNRRQADCCQRVEITWKARGPVIRSEASASDFYTSLDAAVARLESRLRRAADRRRVHHGSRTPTSVAAATGAIPVDGVIRRGGAIGTVALEQPKDSPATHPLPTDHAVGLVDDDNGPGRIVREKEHPATPMSVDQALFEMELVGHDFYLFSDADTGKPSVVYRRRGYDYGLIRLTG